MRSLLVVVALNAGCASLFDLAYVDKELDAGLDAPDAMPDESGNVTCPFGRYGKYGESQRGLFQACLMSAPPVSYSPPPSLDTRVNGNCSYVAIQDDDRRTEVCVIAAEKITIPTSSRFTGNRPLVLVATKTLEVGGMIDVSSRRGIGNGNGAGAGHADCKSVDGASGTSLTAGGGGAGGSFKSIGGNGGGGDDGSVAGGLASLDTPILVFVRGGCTGGDGGTGDVLNSAGGGAGGGAVYLIAGERITLAGTSTIDASGEGGGGGVRGMTMNSGGGGGGGGGSGGLIGLDAPLVTILSGSRLVANGGGGGGGATFQGSGETAATPGTSANLADLYPWIAFGAQAITVGGRGGDATVNGENGTLATDLKGGGGGGGGRGYVKVFATTLVNSGQASPAVDLNP